MENQQPEALALASIFEIRVKMFGEPRGNPEASRAAKELRRLYARNQELEAMLDAVGAGGVSAQRVTQGKDHIAQDRKMVAAPVVLPEPVAAQVRKVMLAINEEQLKKAKSHNTYIVGVIADKIEDGTLFDSGIYRRREIAEIVRNLLSTVTEFQAAAQEPFGYFKAEPFGWRDCAETDEGAVALYEAPQPQAVPDFTRIASRKLKELQDRGYTITGYSIEKSTDSGNVERGFITHGGFIGWWRGQHTNQQPPVGALPPNMFWNDIEAEQCESSPHDVIVAISEEEHLEIGDVIEIQCATRLPNIVARITAVPDRDGNGDLDWEYLDESRPEEPQADARDAERWSEIGKSIERACGELPEDFEINIQLENGAGTVVLLYPDMEECENFPHDDGFAGVVNAAIDAAIAAAKGQS